MDFAKASKVEHAKTTREKREKNFGRGKESRMNTANNSDTEVKAWIKHKYVNGKLSPENSLEKAID